MRITAGILKQDAHLMRIFWNRITLQARLVCLGLVVNVTLIGLLASLALWAAQTLVRDSLT